MTEACKRASSRGFTTVAAAFLVMVLALLSAFLVGLRVHQDSALVLDTLGTRAFAAARAGVEWGAYAALRNGACGGATSLALAGTLSGFTATVVCARSTHNEAATAITVYTIVANACNQPNGGACPNTLTPGANYAERQVTITVAQ